ncbi:hypothetical protein Ancab_028316 [Ancistrocladus abbreviatus]
MPHMLVIDALSIWVSLKFLISQAPLNRQTFKMKLDAAQDKEGNLGLSFVIQDVVGDVLASGGRRCFMVCKSSIAETVKH